ncbi:MAG: nodulation protein NfeD [Deltaproteobacteria bacterium]
MTVAPFPRPGRRLAGLLLALLLVLAGATGARAATVHLLSVDGPIHPASAEYIIEGIRGAADASADAVVVQLDTPGGLLESTREIVQVLLDPPLPVLFYVAPGGAGAASAGVFLVMAANVAAMAPGTTIGASTPVTATGADVDGAMGEKVLNFTAAFAKSIAEERDRNVQWAELAVREALSATDREALENGVIDLIAPSLGDLLAGASGRIVRIGGVDRVLDLDGATVVVIEPNLRQKVVGFLADPTIAYFLLLAGMLGLYLEISNPGTMIPGVIGAICLLIAAASFQILPINLSGLGLIGLGMALLVAELFVPSFGILGIGGFIAFVLGSLFLFEAPGGGFQVDRAVIGAAAAAVASIMLVMATLVVRTFAQKAVSGPEAMIGALGEVREAIDPEGQIFVRGELWKARSRDRLAVDRKARVISVEGLTLGVEAVDPEKEKS